VSSSETQRPHRSEIPIAHSDFACDGKPRGLLSSHRSIESSHGFNMDAALQHKTATATYLNLEVH
jgi:hypothetical protein